MQKDGVRKQFYSSTPGRTGQREANRKNENAVRSFVLSDVAKAVLDAQRAVTGQCESVFCSPPPNEKIPLSICSGGFFHLVDNGEDLPGCRVWRLKSDCRSGKILLVSFL